ncbi:ATP-binding cassette domain-containing protein [Legionella tunisiensis]|uniref:ATP-binding cassette domain-containing protein n=1 Tax=Legionella tunisiensis TaxID=1034944 RepID=UPI0003027698|nr:ATP-binding cassette domain-containing protein [Legionella tunisiensis]
MLAVENLHKNLMKNIIKKVSFNIARGDKCAIIGPNGIGKSTLLKILLNELKSDQGHFEWNETAKIGYFAQDYHSQLIPEQTILQWMERHIASPEQELRKVLGQVLFRGSDVDKKIAMLSGGESARLILAKLILEKITYLSSMNQQTI